MVTAKKISEGAEADVYSTRILGIDCVLKRRRRKSYIAEELDTWIRKRRTKIEARMMGVASMNGISVPRVLLVSSNSIWMERVGGQMLDHAYGGDIPYIVLKRVGALLARLHSLDIVHGDYTTANIMVNDGIPVVIDFGLASQTKSVEEKALDLLLLKRSLGEIAFKIACIQYTKTGRASKSIMSRLGEVERRGRYQNRSLEMEAE